MRALDLGRDGRPLNLLALGAHPDDIEIGCGGTILELLDRVPEVHVRWVVLAAADERVAEAQRAAELMLPRAASRQVQIERFRDGFLPFSGGAVKDIFEAVKASFAPDLILTHYRGDLHQDHRLIAELTWNTFRNHLILEYEIPKYDGDLGSPNVFVPLSEEICRRKIDVLLSCFPSQLCRPWFREDLFLSLLRLRGMEAGPGLPYAEGFYGRKVVLR